MSTINLSAGFSLCPEGEHIFQIVDVVYKEEFGKMEIKMKTTDGYTHMERFNFLDANRQPNEAALSSFSFLAKTAMNDFTLTSIDHTDLIGKYFGAVVEHYEYESRNNPGEMKKGVRLSKKYVATPSGNAAADIDLDALLG